MKLVPSHRSIVGKVIRLPLRALPADAKMPILMGRARGSRWIVGAGDHGHWIGTFDRETRRQFERTITSGAVVYEMGGFVGYFTVLASVLVGPKGRVFTFEPDPRNLRFLREHVRINRLANVTVVEAAVGPHAGTVGFRLNADRCLSRPSGDGEIEVTMIALDDFVRGDDVAPPDYIKIDVVGSEMGVLEGARELIRTRHPVLFMRIHSYDEKPPAWVQLLEGWGYDLTPIAPADFTSAGGVLAKPRG
jgi:FkbM family methyltransferase